MGVLSLAKFCNNYKSSNFRNTLVSYAYHIIFYILYIYIVMEILH